MSFCRTFPECLEKHPQLNVLGEAVATVLTSKDSFNASVMALDKIHTEARPDIKEFLVVISSEESDVMVSVGALYSSETGDVLEIEIKSEIENLIFYNRVQAVEDLFQSVGKWKRITPYWETGVLPDLDMKFTFVWKMACNRLEADQSHYETIIERIFHLAENAVRRSQIW